VHDLIGEGHWFLHDQSWRDAAAARAGVDLQEVLPTWHLVTQGLQHQVPVAQFIQLSTRLILCWHVFFKPSHDAGCVIDGCG
jgi:hypothetical protein